MAPQDTAEAVVRAFCGWHVAPARAEVLVLDGPGTGTLVLPSLYVVELLAITENGTVLDPSGYSWSASGLVRRIGWAPLDTTQPVEQSTTVLLGWNVSAQPRWTNTYRGLQVELNHGYTDMPLEVQSVIDALAARVAEGVGQLVQVGQVRYGTAPDGLPYGASLTDSDKAQLAPYRLPKLP